MHHLPDLQKLPIRLTLSLKLLASEACLFYSVDAKSLTAFGVCGGGGIANERRNLLDLY